MPDESPRTDAPTVRVHGLLRGADLHAEATLEVGDDTLTLRRARGAPIVLRWEAIDGQHAAAGTLALYLAGDDVVEIETGDADALARIVARHACRVGEALRPLRGLGSHRAFPGAEQERFFGPLLAARRAVERAESPDAQLAAVDGPRLAASLRETLAAFASERYPDSAADRRALEAALLDDVDGLLRALARLDAAAGATRSAPDDERFARWRAWAAALRDVFAHADRAWMNALTALAEPAPPRLGFWRRLLGRRGGAVVLAAAFTATALGAQADAGARETVRVRGAARAALAARGFDVVAVTPEGALVVAGPAERARLAREGFAVEPLAQGAEARVPRPRGALGVTAPAVFRPFVAPGRGVRALLDSLDAASDAVHVDSIGASWEGRPILAVKVGPPDDSPARANVVFLATYHAREWIATETALRLLRHLATSPDARTRALVASRDVWIVPVVNPDGYQYTFDADRLWRKNRRPLGGDAVGVDLNRNHRERWGYDNRGSSPEPLAEVYRGPSPGSEPETQAIEQLHERVRPVTSVSYHSFGDLVLYPPGFAAGLLPQDLGVLRTLAGTALHPAIHDRVPGTTIDDYLPGPGWLLYTTNGEYTDWASARHGTLAFTVELTSGCEVDCADGYYGFLFPDDESRVQQVFADNLPFALDVIDAAANPPAFVSSTTGLRAPRLALESASPDVRLRLPRDASATVLARRGARLDPLVMLTDSVPPASFERRLVEQLARGRATYVEARMGGDRAAWRTLATGGAEPADAAWTGSGVRTTGSPRAGTRAWLLDGTGVLRSPVMQVAEDTVTVFWWQRHSIGSSLVLRHGEVRVSIDGGPATPVAIVSGDGPEWYPEQATIGGVAGRTLQLEFTSDRMPWVLDEIGVVARTSPSADVPATVAFRPSANPVREERVRFTWPGVDGRVSVYDFAGREIWSDVLVAGGAGVEWDVRGVANGAYLVRATAGGRSERLTLYVARTAR